MSVLENIFVVLVALIHIYIVWLEMFAWTTRGRKVFKSFPQELFEPTKVMAANQGLYNGFLAAGLIWSFFITDPLWQMNVRLFFLSCVAVAGLYGAYSADKKILFVQTLPACIAIVLVILSLPPK
jgi:putative membrane protein